MRPRLAAARVMNSWSTQSQIAPEQAGTVPDLVKDAAARLTHTLRCSTIRFGGRPGNAPDHHDCCLGMVAPSRLLLGAPFTPRRKCGWCVF